MNSNKITLRNILPLTIKYIFLILVLLITVMPLAYTFFSAFKTNAEIMTYPERFFPAEPTLDNFRMAMQGMDFNIPLMFWNSTWYSAISVLISIVGAALGGYVFARGNNFPGSKVIFAVFSSLMFISLGSITIYATFEILNLFNLSGSLWGLLVMKFFGSNITGIYLMRGYIRSLPPSLDEAAEIDGCSFIRIFFKIILPLLKPIIATLTILAFNGSWNEYLMPTLFTMTRPNQQTLIVGIMRLKTTGGAASNWNLMLAGATVALIPVIVLYAFCNKYFISGLTAGAVKG